MYLLVVPYQHTNKLVMKARAQAALETATTLGMDVFCPAIYCHVIKERNSSYNVGGLYLSIVKSAEGIIIYKLPGYAQDPDVKKAITIATALEIPIQMMEPYPQHLADNYADVWQIV